MAAICALPMTAFAAQDRFTTPLTSSPLTQIKGNVSGRAQAKYDQGRLASDTKISGIRIVFKPSAAQQADLDALLAAQHNPTSPQYHQWITPEQYADRFGLTTSDVQKVTDWLQSQGLTVNEVSPSRNSITVSGTAVQVEQAFQTEMHSYLVNGETHFANSTSPSLPAAIVGSVAGIQGLNNFFPHPKAIKSNLTSLDPKFTSSESGSHFISPADFATIYNVKPLYTAGYTGTGQKIAVVGQTAVYTGDITAFRTAASLPTMTVPTNSPSSSQWVTSASSCSTASTSLCLVCVSSNTGYCSVVSESDLPEADLDLELSGGVAYNANQIFVYDPEGGVFNAYAYAVSHDIAPIISVSYGECEDYDQGNGIIYNQSEATALRVYTQEGNTQGQTTVAAAGDDGAADCDTGSGSVIDNSASQGLQVDIPADIPEVTAMGGSEFYPDAAASCTSGGCSTNGSSNTTPSVFTTTQYWTGTNSADVLSSALSYIPEDVWNDNSISVAADAGFSAGGGGISQIFSKPTWQTTLTVPADTASSVVKTQRDVPDLALSASADHDAYLVCTQVFNTSGTTAEGSSCSNSGSSTTSGFRYSSTQGLTAYGGTSVAAPSFAGILALMEQRNNTTYGNLNTLLYELAGGSTTYASAFHDIQPVTNGILFGANNNNDPCTSGTQNCTTGSEGYSTLVGYDLATGLGSVNAYNLATNATTYTPSTTTITYSPSSVTTSTSTVTLTATVASSSSSVTTKPTGTVVFTVNGTVLSGGPYTLNNGAVSATTSFPNAGVQTVVATYSGDSNFIGSSNTTTITVTPSGTATTSVAVTPTPSTLVLGSSLTLNSTVTSTTTGNITGTITYKIGTATIGTATVSATTGTTGTAAPLTVIASTALGFTANATNTITASYAGNGTYAASSGTTTVSISGIPTYSVSATPMTISSTSNGSVGTTTITLTPQNGYSGTIYTPCTTATENNISISPNTLDLYYNCASTISSTATVSQVSVGSGTAATFPLTFQLNTAAGAQGGTGALKRYPTQSSRLAIFGGGAAVAGLLFFSFSGMRRRKMPILLCLMLFGMAFAGMGCGGSSGSNVTTSPTGSNTVNQAGTYTVTVIMEDSNSLTEQTTFTLTIQ